MMDEKETKRKSKEEENTLLEEKQDKPYGSMQVSYTRHKPK